jgi:16S rRNA (uracil1498-N3)-methyltransferase
MFYADATRDGGAKIEGETAEHLRRVLRVEPGQRYELSDGVRLWLAEVSGFGKARVEFRLLEELPARRPGAEIALFAALVKFDRFEWIVEKASELGVRELVPVLAARCEAGLDKAAAKRVARWRRIAGESGQQSRRVAPMRVAEPAPLSAVVGREFALRVFLDEAGGAPLASLLDAPDATQAGCGVLLGPEGGWTDAERQAVREATWRPVTLGEQILRAETAAIAALSIVQGAYWRRAGT